MLRFKYFYLFLGISFGFFLLSPLSAQIIVTSPSSRETLRSCAEYSDEVLLDRWDMNERTDLGWRIHNTYELPLSYLENISFSGGIFSARSGYTPGMSPPLNSDVNIFILDSAYPPAVNIGKTGKKYPINADKYTILVMRMYLEPEVEGKLYGQGYFYWSKNTIYNGITCAGPFFARNGWFFYFIHMPSLVIRSGNDPWNGLIDSLRMDPIAIADKEIKIDWIRLVEDNSSLYRTITWSGAPGPVDIYLDDDRNAANGNLGALAKNVSGTSYTFLAGGLAPGIYYAAVAPAGTSTFSYSPGYYQVNDTPILKFTRPSEEGSDVDFATLTFGDPWDMANSADVEYTYNIANSSFRTIDYEDILGNVYRNQTVFYGESTPLSPYGDPRVYFLFPWFGKRGTWASIDTNKYHNLVFKIGLLRTYSFADGSIARVIWKLKGEDVENVSKDIVIRHFPDRWLVEKIVLDLKTIPLEEGAGSPSHSGWTGLVDAFRIDPHEFSSPTPFVFDDIRLTADWTADALFTLNWTIEDTDSNLLLSLYYDSDNSGFDGTPIALNLQVAPGTNSYVWDTSSVPEGKYWIYGIVTDGQNSNRAYATGPLIISHGLIPQISLSKNKLYYGGLAGSGATSTQKVIITNSGQGALNWQITKSDPWIEVSPVSGSGNGIIEIGVNLSSLYPGNFQGFITVSDPRASNSPQIINLYLSVYTAGSSSPPFGVIDTPAEGMSGIEGSIPVTGWALDDIEVTKIEIKRDPHPLDNPVVIGPDGLVYIGDGVFVEGARPDVEQHYPGYPFAYRAGWGYMLLTNFLPAQGNGSYRLHAIAYDKEGHRVSLGTKTIYCDNAHATLPFGTIDTPTQGGEASGSRYVNFAWALTPQPKYIPTDGSTLLVWIDGRPLPGRPVYNNYRADIATLFPGYANTNGAVGYYFIDTTQLTNGVHTIAWSVVDSEGKVTGIGSRYFTVINAGSGGAGRQAVFSPVDLIGGIAGAGAPWLNLGRENLIRLKSLNDISFIEISSHGRLYRVDLGLGPIFKRSGYKIDSGAEPILANEVGWFEVSMEQADRLELMLDGKAKEIRKEQIGQLLNLAENNEQRISNQEIEQNITEIKDRFSYAGYLVVGGELRPLPVGSFLDPEQGIFYWQPGPAFIGEYQFIFIKFFGRHFKMAKKIKVFILPKP